MVDQGVDSEVLRKKEESIDAHAPSHRVNSLDDLAGHRVAEHIAYEAAEDFQRIQQESGGNRDVEFPTFDGVRARFGSRIRWPCLAVCR